MIFYSKLPYGTSLERFSWPPITPLSGDSSGDDPLAIPSPSPAPLLPHRRNSQPLGRQGVVAKHGGSEDIAVTLLSWRALASGVAALGGEGSVCPGGRRLSTLFLAVLLGHVDDEEKSLCRPNSDIATVTSEAT
jgi:hypothetical protein